MCVELRKICVGFLFFLFSTSVLTAQVTTTRQTSQPDSTKNDSNQKLKSPVQFQADSLVVDFKKEGDEGILSGNASVVYEEAEINADLFKLFLENDLFEASMFHPDTSVVQFKRGEESFTARMLTYNFRTERGKFRGVRTKLDDGLIVAEYTQSRGDSVLLVKDGWYTTCDCAPNETPSYSLRTSKMKVLNNSWIYTGPIHLRIYNIPLPLWLPFGILPNIEGRRSGPLPPSYGEDDRGFYLKEIGWYWAINDLMDFQIKGGLWSRGSWQISPTFRYNRRYHYNGSLSIDWIKSITGEKYDPDRINNTSRSFIWQHNQNINPTSKFSANVNLRSSDYNRATLDGYNNQSFNDRVRQTTTSRVQYTKQWSNSGRSLSANLSHDENLSTKEATVSFPNVTFTQRTRNPFEKTVRKAGEKEKWYERISYNYTFRFDNKYQFSPDSTQYSWYEGLVDNAIYEEATGLDASNKLVWNAQHSVPISASFTMTKTPLLKKQVKVNISPNITYGETWVSQLDSLYVGENNRLEREKVSPDGSLPLQTVRQASAGVRFNTDIYGTFHGFKLGNMQGLRHILSPSISLNFQPDYRDNPFNYFRTYTDASGNEVQYPIISGIPSFKQQQIQYSLGNVFQTKLVRRDSTGQTLRGNPLQLFSFNIGSGYNFAADSLRFNDISLTGRTRLFEKIDFSLNSTFTPYAQGENNSKLNQFLIHTDSKRFVRMVYFTASVNTSFRSKSTGSGRPFGNTIRSSNSPVSSPSNGLSSFEDEYFRSGNDYIDFDIPWSVNIDFNYSYQPNKTTTLASSHRAIINTQFDFSLTPNWKIQGRSGFDFIDQSLTSTSLSLLRDLDCWEMRFDWTPFGAYRSFKFSLYVKSGKLKNILRLEQPKSDVINRF